jgi:hypothetical protein
VEELVLLHSEGETFATRRRPRTFERLLPCEVVAIDLINKVLHALVRPGYCIGRRATPEVEAVAKSKGQARHRQRQFEGSEEIGALDPGKLEEVAIALHKASACRPESRCKVPD